MAKLTKIQGCKVFLQGLDLLNQTPILDIKPYIPQYDIPRQISKSVEDSNDVFELNNDVEENSDKLGAQLFTRHFYLNINSFTPPTWTVFKTVLWISTDFISRSSYSQR